MAAMTVGQLIVLLRVIDPALPVFVDTVDGDVFEVNSDHEVISFEEDEECAGVSFRITSL